MAQGDQLRALHTPDVVGLAYYVDVTNGNDTTGNGSSGNPWQTIEKGISYLRATATWPTAGTGDVYLYLKAGTYQEATVVSATVTTCAVIWFNNASRAPASNRWFIMCPAPGAEGQVTLKPPSGASDSKEGIRVVNSAQDRYIQIRGLKLDGENTSRGTGDVPGIFIDTAQDVEVVDCEITGMRGASGQKAQGVYSTGARTSVDRCLIHSIGWASGIAGQEHGCYLTGDAAQTTNNVIHTIPNGFGVQYYSGSAGANSKTCSNTIYNVGKSCIVISGNVNGIIKNNLLCEATQYGIEFLPNGSGAGTGVVDNNIFFSNTSGVKDETPAGWTFGDESTADPLFTNAGSADFTLQSGSPAIGYTDSSYSFGYDHNLTARTAGAEDAGALEYVASASGGGSGSIAMMTLRRRRRLRRR